MKVQKFDDSKNANQMTDFCMKCDNRVKGLKGFYETIKHCKSIAKNLIFQNFSWSTWEILKKTSLGASELNEQSQFADREYVM